MICSYCGGPGGLTNGQGHSRHCPRFQACNRFRDLGDGETCKSCGGDWSQHPRPKNALLQTLRQITDGRDVVIFGALGSTWWTDNYAMGRLPLGVAALVEPNTRVRFLATGPRPPRLHATAATEDIAAQARELLDRLLADDTIGVAPAAKPKRMVDSSQGNPVVVLEREDGQTVYVAERYRDIIERGIVQQRRDRGPHQPLLVFGAHGAITFVVMPLHHTVVRPAEQQEATA